MGVHIFTYLGCILNCFPDKISLQILDRLLSVHSKLGKQTCIIDCFPDVVHPNCSWKFWNQRSRSKDTLWCDFVTLPYMANTCLLIYVLDLKNSNCCSCQLNLEISLVYIIGLCLLQVHCYKNTSVMWLSFSKPWHMTFRYTSICSNLLPWMYTSMFYRWGTHKLPLEFLENDILLRSYPFMWLCHFATWQRHVFWSMSWNSKIRKAISVYFI